jgi:small subunit ribosomal protein S16
MLSIRLSRVGRRKAPTYRLLVSEKTKDPWGKYLENLGHYNPHTKEFVYKAERITHWLSKGAQASDTVHNLLLKNGLVTGKTAKIVKLSQRRKEKLQTKKTAAAEKAAKASADQPSES